MNSATGTRECIVRLLLRELDGLVREIGMFPDDESLWKILPGVSNPAGNLALHVAGNLQHYVGAVLGKTGYQRDRDAEFSRRSGSRAYVVAELNRAAAVVRSTMEALSDGTLAEEFPEELMGMKVVTGHFLLHLCVHAGFHLGQAGYLRRILTQDPRSSGALPLKALGG
jgi:hypothetical protein